MVFYGTVALSTADSNYWYSEGWIVVCSYLNEPWAMAIYHDRFRDFRDEVRELLISRPVCTVQSSCRTETN